MKTLFPKAPSPRLLSLLLLTLGALLFLITLGCGPGGDEAWESFSIIMDNAAGSREKWSSKSHSFQGGVLSVEGLRVRISGDFLPFFSKGQRDNAENYLLIESLRVKDLIAPRALNRIIDKGQGTGSKGTKIAGELSLINISDDYSDQASMIFGLRIRGASFSEISLREAPDGASLRENGTLLSRLFMGTSRYEELFAFIAEPFSQDRRPIEPSLTLRIRSLQGTGQGFEGPILGEYSRSEPFGSPSFQSLRVLGLDLFMKEDGRGSISLAFEETNLSDLKGLARIGDSSFRNLSLILKDRYPEDTLTRIITLALSDASGKGLDLRNLVRSLSYSPSSYPSLLPVISPVASGTLIEDLKLNGFTASLTGYEDSYVDLAIKRLDLTKVSLKDVPGDDSPDIVSLFEALTIDLLKCELLEGKVSRSLSQGSVRMTPYISLAVGDITLGKHSFVRDAESELFDITPMGTPRFSELSLNSLKFYSDMENFDGSRLDLTMGSLKISDFITLAEFSEATLTDFSGKFKIFESSEEEGDLKTLSVNFLKYMVKGADFRDLYVENIKLFDLYANDMAYPVSLFFSYYLLDPSFPYSEPYSLDLLEIDKLFVDMEDSLKLELSSGKVEGPFKLGKIAKIHRKIEDLRIFFDPDVLTPTPFQKFLKDNFFLSSITLNLDHLSSPDPESKRYSHRLNNLSVSDICELSYELVTDTVTDELLVKLKDYGSLGPYNLGAVILQNNMGLNKFTLSYKDSNLVTPILKLLSEKNLSSSPEDYAETLIEKITEVYLDPYEELLSTDVVSKVRDGIRAFLNNPKSIEFNVSPEKSINAINLFSVGSDRKKIMDFINASITINGEETIPLAPED
jgi:hypothetical protein